MEQVEGERAEKERKITFPSDSLLSVFSLRPSFDVAVALFLCFFLLFFLFPFLFLSLPLSFSFSFSFLFPFLYLSLVL